MGGGLPAAAFGGRGEVMALLAPLGPVYQAGTLSGNPVAAAAGLATLRPAPPRSTPRRRRRAEVGRRASPRRCRRPACRTSCSGRQPVQRLLHRRETVPDYATAQRQDVARYAAFFHSMLDAGVYLPPSAYEAWFTLRSARRGGDRAHRRGAARRRAAPQPFRPRRPAAAAHRRRGVAVEREDDRPPGAPRRGLQPRKVLYGRLPGFRLSDARARAGRAVAASSPAATSCKIVSSPLERAQQTAAPLARAYGLEVEHRPADHREQQLLRGGRSRPAPASCVNPSTGTRCAIRSGLRGASRTRRSPPG